MSLHEAKDAGHGAARPPCAAGGDFWVVGGCWGDETRSWRRWSEVAGPFADRAQAEAMRQRLSAIYARVPRAHFELVRSLPRDGG